MRDAVCGINYTKRKNSELFQTLKKEGVLHMESVQNYIPIYRQFFNLTPTNYENINLDHPWYLHDINTSSSTMTNDGPAEGSNTVFNGVLKKNGPNSKTRTDNVFCKVVPLVDPYKYMVGKLFDAPEIYNIPTLDNKDASHASLLDMNNNGYVDGMFVYFSNMLSHHYGFAHGLAHYGSFIGVKRNLNVNIYDDVEYLSTSSFFNKHRNVDFTVDDYSYLLNDIIEDDDANDDKKKAIVIHGTGDLEMDDPLGLTGYDAAFQCTGTDTDTDTRILTLNDIVSTDLVPIDLKHVNGEITLDNKSVKSTSSCSSRTSRTTSNGSDGADEDKSEWGDESSSGESGGSGGSGESGESGESGGSDESDEIVNATIPRLPVELIFMEKLEYTLDSLMMGEEELDDTEWMSILMQVIMTLIVYQKVFSFTHNDLHTNNIMFESTKKTHLYYKYRDVVYKVPTFGRIAKIIDFGRSIYTYNGVVICSDSFKPGEDAATQYNTEPYFNASKPRLEPNLSFDLCRLACSIYDEVVDDPDDFGDSGIAKLISDWCKDDNDLNVLYKRNGDERYPSFKLYKMIARAVHRHTPDNQLLRPEFSQYAIPAYDVTSKLVKHIMDVDTMHQMKTRVETSGVTGVNGMKC